MIQTGEIVNSKNKINIYNIIEVGVIEEVEYVMEKATSSGEWGQCVSCQVILYDVDVIIYQQAEH
jgi:hypothetical protein